MTPTQLRDADVQPASLEVSGDKAQEIVSALNVVTDRMVDDVTAALAAMGLTVAVSPGSRSLRIVEVLPLGLGSKLAVVEFQGRELLVSVSKTDVRLIADSHD